MAAGPQTQVSDIVVPEIFSPYVQQITAEKSNMIQAGALVQDASLNGALAGGGLTFNEPSYQDLDNDEDRVSSDSIAAGFTGGVADPDPLKIETGIEVQVRLSRNNSWSSADLAGTLAGSDPQDAIANRVGYYWTRRLQAAFTASVQGIFASNAANEGGDMIYDNSNGGTYQEGVTDFNTKAFLAATLTMGDSMKDLTMVQVHSVVYNTMQNNNLIDFIPDSNGVVNIPTYLGRRVIVDDGLPVTGAASNVYSTWLFGAAALRLGMGSPKVPTEVDRLPGSGNGGGSEVLYNRTEWVIHPVGNAFVGTPTNGGPTNTVLADATSWARVYPERKQIKMTELLTTEHA